LGTKEFIALAKRNRKILGGSMRQIGVLAAPGIYALNNMITQIKEHNENCKLFREKIENIKKIKPRESSSNILII
jgi:threonine aldolase